jgi:hypothetical protein
VSSAQATGVLKNSYSSDEAEDAGDGVCKSDCGSDKGFITSPWTTEMTEAMGRFNDELLEAGILLMVGGFKPS